MLNHPITNHIHRHDEKSNGRVNTRIHLPERARVYSVAEPQRVALIGSSTVPLAPDDALFIAALESEGYLAEPLDWEVGLPEANDSEQSLAALVMRSAWNYAESAQHSARFDTFLGTLRDSGATVANPAGLMRFGFDKFYLKLFREATLPSLYLERGCLPEPGTLESLGNHWVVKPRYGCNASGVERLRGAEGTERLSARLRNESVIVQRFEPGIFIGELSVIYINGRYCHAVLKKPVGASMFENRTASAEPSEFRTQSDYGGTVTRVMRPDPHALALAEHLSSKLFEITGLLADYLRIDLISTPAGWRLLELSLLEETLYFEEESLAAYRLARHLRARIEKQQRISRSFNTR